MVARAQENRTFNEVIGLVLLGLGTLLFLALISYEPRDLPGWFPLSYTSGANGRPHNIMGRVGAIGAGSSYFLLGAASYLVAAVMLVLGAIKLFSSSYHLRARFVWIFISILAGACLIEIQPWFLHDWPAAMNIRSHGGGAGGWLGYWLGKRLLRDLFGLGGAGILLFCLYVITVILMTGIQPVRALRAVLAAPPRWLQGWRLRRMEKADERERLVLEEKRLARETRKLEKTLTKKGVRLPEPGELPFEEEIPVRPAPKVIDTSVPEPKKKEKLVPKAPARMDDYKLPELTLLDEADTAGRRAADPEELRQIQATVIDTLAQFGISVSPGDITKGPTITRYEVYPAKGVRVDKIVSLERDIARSTRAERINILAPIPGKDTVGIEIANSRKQKVTLRELLESEEWLQTQAKIPLALGKDVYGKTILADLSQMPHCLVAGTTGSGKSVCINALIASMLYRFTPDQLRLIMIDPKVVEMQIYNSLPHLIVPVVTDPKKVLLALRYVIDEMEKRYKIFAKTGVRNITGFNARPKPKSKKELEAEGLPVQEPGGADGESAPPIQVPRDDDIIIPERMYYIVVIIDELADLMQTAPADVESAIARITQMARAAGIHMIVATQTPRADIVTGVIKANIPSRIAFQVATKIDSRVILDENGAERLLGQGDMLYVPPGTSRVIRAQGVLVTDEEIKRLVDFAQAQSPAVYEPEIHDKLQTGAQPPEEVSEEDEELVEKCIEIMRQEKKASTSLFQRRLRLGYTRAARVVDILEQRGYVAAGEGAKPREILKDLDEAFP